MADTDLKSISTNPREAAYFAILQSQRGQQFVAISLDEWKNHEMPSKPNFALAYEIASGATRRAITLDFIGEQLANKGRLRLRTKEKALLRIGLYQAIFMDRIPMYAVVDETVEVAKKHCHETFVSFLNAILRKVYAGVPILPMDSAPESLSIYYSYPRNFIIQLIEQYGLEKTKLVLEVGNEKPIVMARLRPGFDVVTLDKISVMRQAAMNNQFYIQNITPAHLMRRLAEKITKQPSRFLDLCAAPGGKLLAAHDLFPNAAIYGNEPSPDRLKILRKNLEKYRVPAVLSTLDGLRYPTGQLFDLMILDVPCSNSGVLNKRAEARWRLDEASLRELEQKQLALLRHSVDLAQPGGEIWYLTCSILNRENQKIVNQVVQEGKVKLRKEELILPNKEGWDGGYACALVKVE